MRRWPASWLLVEGLRRWRFASWLLLAAFLATPAASAEEVRVVVVGDDDATTTRLRDELRLLGFRVEMLQTDEVVDPADLARLRGAVAVMRVEQPSGDVVIWVEPESARLPELSGTMRVEARASGGEPPGLVALRAVEMLRGRLVKLPPQAEEPPLPAPTPPAEPRSEPAPVSEQELLALALRPPGRQPIAPETPMSELPSLQRARRWRAVVSPAVAFGPGGVPPTAQLRIAGAHHPWWRLGVELHLLAPLTAANVEAERGSASLRLLSFGTSLSLRATQADAAFSFQPALGIDAVALVYQGRAEPPFATRRGVSWSAMPHATLALAYRLWPWLAIRADPQLGLLVPEQVTRIRGTPIASLGRPLAVMSLGLEVRP